jgi:hypothetical protein
MNYKIPTIEEIYNEYHKMTIFESKGFYPKTIKNFDKILTESKKELLTRFQNVIKRNYELLDWKLYIQACSKYFKGNFDLQLLGSLKGNKIYRLYVNYENFEKSEAEIESEIINSLKFIKLFCSESEITINKYFHDRSTNFPICIKHLYSGSVSPYFYGIFHFSDLFKIFGDIPDDVFYELFRCSRNEFLDNNINKKHDKILSLTKLFPVINKINISLKSKI